MKNKCQAIVCVLPISIKESAGKDNMKFFHDRQEDAQNKRFLKKWWK